MKRALQAMSMLAFMLVLITGFMHVTAGADPCQDPTDPLACACTAGANSSAACNTSDADPVNGTLKKVSLIIATIAGIAAVIIIIIAGLQFITSGGDAQKVAGARNAILGSVIGIVIIVSAESIILFVVSKT
ncbi:MAG: TrbC/VirB2 family protein [Candidatus Saccharibacteria bacterium]